MSDGVGAPEAPRALHFFETLGVALATYVAFVAGGWLTAVALFVVRQVSSTSPDALSDQAYYNAVVLLGAFPWALAVIWWAVPVQDGRSRTILPSNGLVPASLSSRWSSP
jgi:hypothetical protein